MLVFGFIAALIAAISWALSSAVYKVGSKGVSPLTANLLRIVPALIILTLIGLILNVYPSFFILSVNEWLLILGSSIFAFVIGDAFYFVAILKLGVSRAVPITNIYPLFVLILQIAFLGQIVHILIIPAALITVAGVILLGRQIDSDSSSPSDLKSRHQLMFGLIAAILTPLCWSISIIFLSQVLQTTNLVLVALVRLTIALLILTPMVMVGQFVRPEKPLTRRVWLYLGIGGIIALVAGYISFAIALQFMDTTSATLISSLTPLFALVIGWRSLRERVNWLTVLGVIACVSGIVLITIAVSLI